MSTIIFGAGEYGKKIYNDFFKCEKSHDIFFYDNDRRKWGTLIENIQVINFNKFSEMSKIKNNKIFIGTKNESALFFLQDLNPVCEIYKIQDEKTVAQKMDEIGSFNYDNSFEIGKKNLENHLKRLDFLKNKKNTCAYEHALKYIEYKKEHISLPEISSLEFTNNCNLKCPNCPNSSLSFHKGFMSDEVFEEALKYIPPYTDDTIAVHCMGEPLLHPKFLIYIEKLAKLEVNICMSTNGILLDRSISNKILSIFSKLTKSVIYISFHSKKSVENWFEFLQLYKQYENSNILFRGQVLEHNQEEAYKWLREIGVYNPENHPYIRHITSHSFAGNVPGRKTNYNEIEVLNRIRNCYYLRERKVAVMWDGTLRGCCYDSNAEYKCGNIFDFENCNINPYGYELCRHCDPDWITNYQ